MLDRFIFKLFRMSYYEFQKRYQYLPWLFFLVLIYLSFQPLSRISNHTERESLEAYERAGRYQTANGGFTKSSKAN